MCIIMMMEICVYRKSRIISKNSEKDYDYENKATNKYVNYMHKYYKPESHI